VVAKIRTTVPTSVSNGQVAPELAERVASAHPERSCVRMTLQTMKCIDLFHSSDVDRVVRRFAPRQ
jgi:hypothetical protein